MTKIQLKFYNILKQQIVDFDEIFHKEFTIKRIEQIPDEQLKYLLEDITANKDNIGKKAYIDYAKFVYYADKMIKNIVDSITLPKVSKVDQLYKKRELLLKTIEDQTNTIAQRNQLIEDLKNKKIMFKDQDKNILDDIDYFIIEQFGFYNFFDENRNYHVKEDIEKYLKQYTAHKLIKKDTSIKKLTSF